MSDVSFYMLSFVFVLFLLTAGWLINDAYRYYTNHREYNGLYIQNNSYQNAIETSFRYDKYGDWVCINTNGMDFDEIVETCQHEAGHEIFAEVIESNPEKIEEVMEVIGK